MKGRGETEGGGPLVETKRLFEKTDLGKKRKENEFGKGLDWFNYSFGSAQLGRA